MGVIPIKIKSVPPCQNVWQNVDGTLNGIHAILQIGNSLVHDVLTAVDVGQDLVDVVLSLEAKNFGLCLKLQV